MMGLFGVVRASKRYLERSIDTDSSPPHSSSPAEEEQFDEDSTSYDQKGTVPSGTSSAHSQEGVKQKVESVRVHPVQYTLHSI